MEPRPNQTCCATNSFSILLLSIGLLAVVSGSPSSHHHVLEPRQSSDGCGQNPLVALVSYAREFADFSPQQLVRFIETDRRAWGQLRSLLKTYDDCVRTGDGTRYKRPYPDDAAATETPVGDRIKSRDSHESWKRILRTLVLGAGYRCRTRHRRRPKMRSKVGVIILLPALMATLATEVHPTIDDFSLEKNDPNSGRASRLLYSPRSGASRVHNVDMHSILRRLRESQQQKHQALDPTPKPEFSENADSVHGNVGQLETQPEGGVRRTQIIEEPRSVKIHTLSKEACHAHHLQKCGASVIDGFAAPGLTMGRKCRIREHFLTCMIKMKRRPCRSRSRFVELDEESMGQFRQKILSLLWTARGCVLGIEVP